MLTKEEAIKKTLQEIDEMQAVNAALPEIKRVVARFDGKVLNKRLDDALKEAGLPGRIYLSTHYENSWEINFYPDGARSNNYYTVLHGARPSCEYYSPENSFVDENKRISAERAFKIIEAGRVERLQKITAYRDHLETWEVKKAQIETLKKELKILIDSIPYGIRSNFISQSYI